MSRRRGTECNFSARATAWSHNGGCGTADDGGNRKVAAGLGRRRGGTECSMRGRSRRYGLCGAGGGAAAIAPPGWKHLAAMLVLRTRRERLGLNRRRGSQV